MILQPNAYFVEASAHLWQMHCFCLPALPPALHALSHLPSRLASKFPNSRRKRGGDRGERVCFIPKGSCTSYESGVTAIGISLLEESPELRAPSRRAGQRQWEGTLPWSPEVWWEWSGKGWQTQLFLHFFLTLKTNLDRWPALDCGSSLHHCADPSQPSLNHSWASHQSRGKVETETQTNLKQIGRRGWMGTCVDPGLLQSLPEPHERLYPAPSPLPGLQA